MITRQDVEAAYTLLLGRPPEDGAIEHWMSQGNIKSTLDLLRSFMGSDEFRENRLPSVYPSALRVPIRSQPIQVQTSATSDQLDQLFRNIKDQWQKLGNKDPHWSVLTSDQFLSENIEESIGDFYSSGSGCIDLLDKFLARNNIDTDQFDTCFELGCGVGRLTTRLAEKFKNVIAADISAPHLNLTKQRCESLGIGNVRYELLDEVRSLDAIKGYDFFYSIMVFQHNPPPVIAWMLRSILTNLNSGGVAYFQVPSYIVGYGYDLDDYLKNGFTPPSDWGFAKRMEMHPLPQSNLFSICKETNCTVAEVREDGYAGEAGEILSNLYVIRKSGS